MLSQHSALVNIKTNYGTVVDLMRTVEKLLQYKTILNKVQAIKDKELKDAIQKIKKHEWTLDW